MLVYLQIYGVQNPAGVCCNYYYNWFRTEAVADTTAPHRRVTPVDGRPASVSTPVS
jgi:hypothetical protein